MLIVAFLSAQGVHPFVTQGRRRIYNPFMWIMSVFLADMGASGCLRLSVRCHVFVFSLIGHS